MNSFALSSALPDTPAAKPKLLVVDDQPINIQVMHQLFAGEYQVFMATSGPQAIKLCKTNPPDLVLLDIVMPGMDGHEVCRQLKADTETRDIPIIFVTAHTDSDQESQGLELGAVDFITKPVVPAVVRARVRTHVTLKQQSDLLRKMVFLDGLLGVFNRRYFDQQIETEWSRSQRSGTPLSVLMIDVDFFKRYNDTYGHLAGDDCLRSVATEIRHVLRRPADVVARYGGEEFACILPETPLVDAITLAKTLEQSVRALGIPHSSSDTAKVVTVSIGAACKPPIGSGTASDLVSQADAQLYRAKHLGRGQVCAAEPQN
ncbi:diguanylate cyclase [Curvibacter sp. APW13]|uniref:diguanylate cyclase n=1 Tax=Curvibacter sp. APW13 TaxID=3077236 RepID=UPI0028DE021B|nr:diguanylate cyclase [Curvibacter sp. APW13]MDT8990095.1 diguanylate cyclase [Curvibacter sp. APW13]